MAVGAAGVVVLAMATLAYGGDVASSRVMQLVNGAGDSGLIATIAAIILASFISEDLTCIGCGLLAATGTISITTALVGCFLGLWIGDVGIYWGGRLIGRRLLKIPPFKWIIKESAVSRGTAWLKRRGAMVVFIGRFVPGSRMPTYFASGLLRTNAAAFAIYFALASAAWVPLLVGGTYLAGEALANRIAFVAGRPMMGLIALGVLLLVAVKVIEPLCSHRGRRLAVGSWKRKLLWEFWPSWVANMPVVLHGLWLGVKHDNLALFTAGNPGIELGGFVGESKTRILNDLDPPAEFRLAMTLLAADEAPADRLVKVRAFMDREGLSYPIVLKPDVGERGKGVHVVRSDEQALEVLAGCVEAMIVQEYAAGEDFGIFYYRHPTAERGGVYSITRKVFPVVTGDGWRTLEHLILDDPRAVCAAKLYLRVNARRLDYVPRAGKTVQLCEIGNHAQGAIFMDARDLKTPEMEAAFERVARRFKGFYFGRFDVRTRSIEEFQCGVNFKIVELNGVTSGPSHVYDPSIPTREVYRTLFQQWRILFEIAAHNVAAGARKPMARQAFRALWDYYVLRGLGMRPKRRLQAERVVT